MNWELLVEIGNFAVGIIGVIGGTAGIIFWRAARKEKEAAAKEKEANAQTAKIEAMGKEADFAETMLQKFEKAILARMDSNDSVRKQEFEQLRTDLGGQLTNIQVENRQQNSLLQDIVMYLDGPFKKWLEEKDEITGTSKPKGKKK